MKILYVTRTLYPEGAGGGEISAFEIGKAVSSKITPVFCTLSERIDKEKIEYIDNIKIYRFPWKKLWFSKKLSNQLIFQRHNSSLKEPGIFKNLTLTRRDLRDSR